MIGLLTFQDTNNFGACLQALALYRKVRECGYDVEIIDYRNERIYRNEVLSLKPGRDVKKMVRWVLYDHSLKSKYKALSHEFRALAAFSPVSYDCSDISQALSRYDTVMVGSDQVWALNVTGNDYTYFLDFADRSTRRLAFASSISNEEEFRRDTHAQSLLSGFDKIAVREEEARDVIAATTGRAVDWVCDPTMLYDARQWDEIIPTQNRYKKKYVLIYFVDPDRKIFRDAVDYARRNNCKVLYCGLSLQRGINSVSPKTMADWLGLIKNCDALFTASYHGMLFGLYYGKPLAYYNRNQKSRMNTLGRFCGIEANDGSSLRDGIIPVIDYNSVQKRLSSFREYSDEVLRNMLSNND